MLWCRCSSVEDVRGGRTAERQLSSILFRGTANKVHFAAGAQGGESGPHHCFPVGVLVLCEHHAILVVSRGAYHDHAMCLILRDMRPLHTRPSPWLSSNDGGKELVGHQGSVRGPRLGFVPTRTARGVCQDHHPRNEAQPRWAEKLAAAARGNGRPARPPPARPAPETPARCTGPPLSEANSR